MNKITIVTILAIPLLSIVGSVFGETMNSSQYRIQYGNINTGGGFQTSPGYRLSTTVGQSVINESTSSGYIVKAGFQYLPYIAPFSFSISNRNIDFGVLQAEVPSTATTILTVSFQGAGQYVVTAVEDGPLQTTSGAGVIPDTTCNGGAEACTISSANLWTSATAYGFGYNMSGDSIPADFVDSTYFRPFPDSIQSQSPQTVMSSSNVTESSSATMTFKTNISKIQEAGTYQTVIRFTATPSF